MPEVEAFETELGELRRVRRFIREGCAGVGEEAIERLLAVADEAFANIVSHGETEEAVFISLMIEGGRVVLELWDQGRSFDPMEVPVPDLAEGREQGMGVVILRELADEIAYFPKEGAKGWNRLQLSVVVGNGN
ncbi:MAG: ATP-binding protein [Parachlamydiales bacterium]